MFWENCVSSLSASGIHANVKFSLLSVWIVAVLVVVAILLTPNPWSSSLLGSNVQSFSFCQLKANNEAQLKNINKSVARHSWYRWRQSTEATQGHMRISHMLSGACYQLWSEVWSLSIGDNRWAGTCGAVADLQASWDVQGWDGLDRCVQWSREECEEKSSWQTAVQML